MEFFSSNRLKINLFNKFHRDTVLTQKAKTTLDDYNSLVLAFTGMLT